MARQSSGVKSFYFLDKEFFYQVKNIKSLRLKLNEKGEFYLSIPKFYPLEKVKEFLAKNEDWIQKTWQNFESKQKNINENEIYFLGKKYLLNLNENFKKTQILKGEIKSASKEDFEKFLRMNAKIIFSFYLQKWSEKTGLHYTHLSIKKMKTRWGSCNHKKGYINLNLKLLEKSLKAIEYVILHELAHLKFPNHSKEFYGFIFEFMSDFKDREKMFKISFK
ncbi:M48 family metallopeptidase [Campylobacter sp. US33a]|uniref:M48 family metallopeptidase n=1 Tax=Campylobacter sp. US33a TaxID=2498120 RepID=UPI0010675B90|nr:M48 family peptidase [Campylobacter sp. US33a]